MLPRFTAGHSLYQSNGCYTVWFSNTSTSRGEVVEPQRHPGFLTSRGSSAILPVPGSTNCIDILYVPRCYHPNPFNPFIECCENRHEVRCTECHNECCETVAHEVRCTECHNTLTSFGDILISK